MKTLKVVKKSNGAFICEELNARVLVQDQEAINVKADVYKNRDNINLGMYEIVLRGKCAPAATSFIQTVNLLFEQ